MLDKALRTLRKLWTDEDGVTSLEYMVMVSMIVIVCLLTINTIGQFTQTSFSNTSNSISSATGD